jgi:hypothetical protein
VKRYVSRITLCASRILAVFRITKPVKDGQGAAVCYESTAPDFQELRDWRDMTEGVWLLLDDPDDPLVRITEGWMALNNPRANGWFTDREGVTSFINSETFEQNFSQQPTTETTI